MRRQVAVESALQNYTVLYPYDSLSANETDNISSFHRFNSIELYFTLFQRTESG